MEKVNQHMELKEMVSLIKVYLEGLLKQLFHLILHLLLFMNMRTHSILGKFITKINFRTLNIDPMIQELKDNNWIDIQTKAVLSNTSKPFNTFIVKKVFIGKGIGSYSLIDISLELVLDHVTRSISAYVVTPLFQTEAEIILSTTMLVSTVLMFIISLLDLHNKYIYEERMMKLKDKLHRKVSREMLEKKTEAKESESDMDNSVDGNRAAEEQRQQLIQDEVEKRIGCWRRIIYRFRAPNIFEVITFLFVLMYWGNFILKLIFHALFTSVEIKENKFTNLLGLEAFQYTIFFIDYFIAWSLSAVLV